MGDMVLSAFLFALMAAGAKVAGRHVPLQEIVFVRGVACTLMTWWMLRRAGAPWRGTRPGLLALRGALGYVALSCYFLSIAHLPLAQAVLIQQVHPVFTVVLAFLFLGEPPGGRFWPALALAAAGVLLLVSPDPLEVRGDAWALVGIVGAFGSGAAYVAVRSAVRTEHPLTIILWFPAVSAVLSLPAMLASGPVAPSAADWFWLGVVSLAGQLGQVYLTRGLSRVPAGRATLANPMTIAFGAVLGWLGFGEGIGWNTLCGGLLVVAAVLLARPGRAAASDSYGTPGAMAK
ncbi:MAG: DMT family transporter [Acidobacteria bacterium]|nr:DMT family transporter [Acidobacteriota bacterium]